MKISQNAPVVKTIGWFALSLIGSVLVACGGGGGSSNDFGAAAGMGTLRLAMTDAPACGYDHVYVTVNKIRVSQSSGDTGWHDLPIAPQRIDLLNLTNGVLAELGSFTLPAGSYQQIRLVLADNTLANAVVLSDTTTEIPLTTPSAQQSGLKLQAHFEVPDGQMADMVLDFDACKSIVKAGKSGNYNLKPVVAVIKRLVTGITGYVDVNLLVNDIVVSTRDPDGNLRATVPDSFGKFTLAYLPENTNYTVVVTGRDLTTAAVTGVPVTLASGTTQINSGLEPIRPDRSATATITGVVADASSPPNLILDANVNAKQTLSSGEVLDVNWQLVDPVTAVYSMNLPLAAPVKAPYVSPGSLVFTADSLSGRYHILASATGYITQITDPHLTLTSADADTTTTKDLTLAP